MITVRVLSLWTNLIHYIKSVKYISRNELAIDKNGWLYFDTFRYLKYVSMLLGQKGGWKSGGGGRKEGDSRYDQSYQNLD